MFAQKDSRSTMGSALAGSMALEISYTLNDLVWSSTGGWRCSVAGGNSTGTR